jgi:hypothetical protein
MRENKIGKRNTEKNRERERERERERDSILFAVQYMTVLLILLVKGREPPLQALGRGLPPFHSLSCVYRGIHQRPAQFLRYESAYPDLSPVVELSETVLY